MKHFLHCPHIKAKAVSKETSRQGAPDHVTQVRDLEIFSETRIGLGTQQKEVKARRDNILFQSAMSFSSLQNARQLISRPELSQHSAAPSANGKHAQVGRGVILVKPLVRFEHQIQYRIGYQLSQNCLCPAGDQLPAQSQVPSYHGKLHLKIICF